MSRINGKIIRVGIAGQGRSGYAIHAEWLRKAGETYLITAVADQLKERRDEAEKEFGARTYADWRKLVKAGGFDLFINALPSPLHLQATIEALEAGYHVVCEKPMAGTVIDFDLMVATAEKTGKMLAPFQNNRFQPFFQKILEIVRQAIPAGGNPDQRLPGLSAGRHVQHLRHKGWAERQFKLFDLEIL